MGKGEVGGKGNARGSQGRGSTGDKGDEVGKLRRVVSGSLVRLTPVSPHVLPFPGRKCFRGGVSLTYTTTLESVVQGATSYKPPPTETSGKFSIQYTQTGKAGVHSDLENGFCEKGLSFLLGFLLGFGSATDVANLASRVRARLFTKFLLRSVTSPFTPSSTF